MSRDAEDRVPPHRPKPSAKRPAAPKPVETGGEPSPWLPNPKPATGGRSTPRPRDVPAPVSGGPNLRERVLFGRVSSGQLAAFCRQFASYLDSGVDILKAL